MPEKNDHDMIVEMHHILCGNGTKGLCQDFEEHVKDDSKFRAEYYKFKRNVLMVWAFVLGTGALGVGAFKFSSVIFGG